MLYWIHGHFSVGFIFAFPIRPCSFIRTSLYGLTTLQASTRFINRRACSHLQAIDIFLLCELSKRWLRQQSSGRIWSFISLLQLFINVLFLYFRCPQYGIYYDDALCTSSKFTPCSPRILDTCHTAFGGSHYLDQQK